MTFYKLLKQNNSIHLKDNQLDVKISKQSLNVLHFWPCVIWETGNKTERRMQYLYICFLISCDILTTVFHEKNLLKQ